MVELNKLLPIGSIVKLKTETKRLMIIGIFQIAVDDKQYDYSGLVYPEGLIGDNQFLFNHDDIESVCFRGYEDSERFQMLLDLEQQLDKQDEEATEKIMNIFKYLYNSKNSNNEIKINISKCAKTHNITPDMLADVIEFLVDENYLIVINKNKNKYQISEEGLALVQSDDSGK